MKIIYCFGSTTPTFHITWLLNRYEDFLDLLAGLVVLITFYGLLVDIQVLVMVILFFESLR